jgi:hypothetical protein
MSARRVVFVCGSATGEALRCANAIKNLDDVTLEICNGDDLIEAAKKFGNVYRIVTAQETLLATVAEANEALGLEAMSSEVVARTLDKSKLKSTLRQAGVTTPRDTTASHKEDVRRFVDEVGFPIVLKPLNGSGALTTFRVTNEEELSHVLEILTPPVIAETYVNGQELCFDTVTIANEPQCYSVCCYDRPILDALEDPSRQWRCVMPRDLTAYKSFIEQGLTGIRSLQVGNAITHMEGFIDASRPAGFIDATLRPAGARIGPMFGFAHDVDPYRVWARVAVNDTFDGPLERKYAVGTIFLRSPGSGFVEIVDGIETINEALNSTIVEARWPGIHSQKSATYTGDGFVTVRHPDMAVVENALDFIDQTIRITYTSSQPLETGWGERMHNFRQLNKPVWDFEAALVKRES